MPPRPYSRVEVQALEANAEAHGRSIPVMMERAGEVVAEEVRRHVPSPPGPIGIVCGSGNNGGDGMAAATCLLEVGYQIRLWLLEGPGRLRTPAARDRYERLRSSLEIRVGSPSRDEVRSLPLVIDAMIGTGGRGELRDPYAQAVANIEEAGVPVLSVDLPTGLGTSHPLKAKWTVSLEVIKEGMADPACGEVIVRSIGMPREAFEETGPGEFALFPVPSEQTIKSDAGRLVIIGGGPYAGAPFLAGMGALRGGCDMVFLVVPSGVADVVQGFSPEVIVRGVGQGRMFQESDIEALSDLVASLRPTALLLGNGAGAAPPTVRALSGLVDRVASLAPVVLDADAIRLLPRPTGGAAPPPSPDRWLATPNRREFAHVAAGSEESLVEATPARVRETATKLGVTLLVKGPVDVMSDGERTMKNRTHHPSMVVGGAGDVLAGLAASLVARRLSPLQAARLSSFWLGRAGLEAFEETSHSILPLDLARALGPALRRGLSEIAPARLR